MATSVPAAGSWEAARAPLLLCAAVLAAAAARALAEWAWLRPRRLGRALRAQGLRGTADRPLAGDAPLADRLAREARARPPLPPGCHAVVPRAAPLFHHAIPEHGTCVAAFDLLSRRRRRRRSTVCRSFHAKKIRSFYISTSLSSTTFVHVYDC